MSRVFSSKEMPPSSAQHSFPCSNYLVDCNDLICECFFFLQGVTEAFHVGQKVNAVHRLTGETREGIIARVAGSAVEIDVR